MKEYVIYRIYYDYGIVYVGQTAQPLNRRLHGHFFARPMMRKIDPREVKRIDRAVCNTRADMNLYEIYYIEKLKPLLNFADKDSDELTVSLPDLDFAEYECTLLDKWRREIAAKELDEAERHRKRIETECRQRELRQQRRDGLLKDDEYYKAIDSLNLPEG